MHHDDDFSMLSSRLSNNLQPRRFQQQKQFRILFFCLPSLFSQPEFVGGFCRKGKGHDEIRVSAHDDGEVSSIDHDAEAIILRNTST